MKIKINFSNLKGWLLLIPFFQPMCFDYILRDIGRVYMIWLLLAMPIILLGYIQLIKRRNENHGGIYIIFLTMYFGVYAISSVYNGQSVTFNTWGRWTSIIVFCMLLQVGYHKEKEEFIKKISIYLQILIWINFIIKLIYPHGLAQTETYGNYIHFMANKNGLTPIYIFMFATMIFGDYTQKIRISIVRKLYIVILAATIIPFNSGTGSLCCLAMATLIIIGFDRKIIAKFSYFSVWGIYIIATILLVFAQITNIFQPIFELVNKDSTLTGRIYIWEMAIARIGSSMKNIILGSGYMTSGYITYKNGLYTSHNMVLEILLRGGIIAFLIFCGLIICVGYRCLRGSKFTLQVALNWSLFLYLLGTLTEPLIAVQYMYGLLMLIMLAINWQNSNEKRDKGNMEILKKKRRVLKIHL